MKTAFAVKEDQIAPTLGSATHFLLLENAEQLLLKAPAKSNIFSLLLQHEVKELVCGNIGNCMLAIFERQQINVLAGVHGSIEQVLRDYKQNSLRREKAFTCTENGQICGDCPGNF